MTVISSNEPSSQISQQVSGVDRLAKGLLGAIEQRIINIQIQTEQMLNMLINDAPRRTDEVRTIHLTTEDFERHIPEWIALTGTDLNLRAAIIRAIAAKYPLVEDHIPNIRTKLGLDTEQMQQVFLTQYGRPIEELYRSLTDTAKVMVTTPPSDTIFHMLKDSLRWKSAGRGEMLFRQGDESDGMYIVLHGRLRAFKEGQENSHYLRDMGPGESVGEMSIITHERRSASVYVLRDSLLLQLTREAFDALADSHPRFLISITRTLVERLSHTPDNVSGVQAPRTIALVPLGNAVPMTRFFQQLTEALQPYGKILQLNKRKATFESMLHSSQVDAASHSYDSSLLVSWLNDQESNYSLILYEADPADPEWTTRCLRQADKIVLVAKADSDPSLYEIETSLVNSDDLAQVKVELVLLHPDRNHLPQGTDRWLDSRKIHRHYHISLTTQGDFERLARGFTGNLYGLVLGGGGTRAFAHAGVVRAIHEANVPIDTVCGSSAGAIAAALVATGATADEMLKKAQFLFNTFNDYTFPLVSVMAGHKLVEGLKEIFGSIKIEDLWTDFFCISSNLNQAQMVIHHRGLLYKAIRASASLPGIFPPVISPEGDLLIDGAVMNNVPADIMYDYNGDNLIVVDVGNEAGRKSNYTFGESISGWRLLLNRINPLRRRRLKVPSLVSIMSRATFLASMQHKAAYDKDSTLYMKPPVGSFSPFSMNEGEEITRIGYDYAKEKIGVWKASKQKQP